MRNRPTQETIIMSNSYENYNISDFTREHYQTLIKLAKENYKFCQYNEMPGKENNVIYWRHDVDLSIHSALKLAVIEASEGIKSTFFLLPHSDFYNLLEQENTEIIYKILDLGHNIALHFDSHYHGIKNEDELERALEKEKVFFQTFFNIELNVFSFHNTNEFTMSCKRWVYANLINVYAQYFQNNVKYCSDSNGYWRFERLYDLLNDTKYNRLQVLTHPVWWQRMPMLPFKRIQRSAYLRYKKQISNYESLLKEYNRKNVK